MLLALVVPAFALTVPVRATYKEDIVPGEIALASFATTAAVTSISNPTTGVVFKLSGDELTANKREAKGSVALSFLASPADSVRTWTIYLLDGDGQVLGTPEVVDVSFDALGNGSIAARGASSCLSSLGVKASDRTSGGFTKATTKLSVQDSGADAAFIGIVELKTSAATSALATDPDMTVMDSDLYAAFQALDLDAIVALDSYTIQLEGTVDVSGVAVASTGVVESGADLQWDIGFFTGDVTCERAGACTPDLADTVSYLQPIGTVKKKAATPPRVNLKDSDVLIDSVDASFNLTIQGDVRNLEVSAAMDVFASNELIDGRDVVALDPGGFGVEGKSAKDDDDDTGIIIDIFVDVDTDILDDDLTSPAPGPWGVMTATPIEVVVLDGDGQEVSTHTCQLVPTAATLADTSKRDVLVGQCTHADGGTEVRRLRASVGDAGWIRWSVDLAGPAFAETRVETTCEKEGACTDRTVSVLAGRVVLQHDGQPFLSRPLTVTETDFDLPFLFDWNIANLDTSVSIDLYTTNPVYWSVLDGVVTAKDGAGVVASFDVEDIGLAPTGDCNLKGWGVDAATAPKEKSVGPVVLSAAAGHQACK